ncbi:T9SS type A sorting domain-containing protein [Chryseobacterium sp. GMJ5]|uniref:T9SS type A sorting domain-containing protein n=1 Tax=Chryseobacterium gilvum TaxID=2976534 RepID=A0ABT2VTD9_9FLAO|nr:T9SS type A sorting domain-containing protein [Chryseobacterium gilvum]MCU7613257.1 T9SS type A sorting domain-containing protein [Chryseobacterium gilvum]
MKKLLLLCMMAFGVGASAQIVVSESFEGSALPTGWTSFSNATLTTTTGVSFGSSAGTPCAGTKGVYKNLYSSVPAWYLVYSSTASNGTAMTYSFKYLAKSYDATVTVKGSVAADYSVDGGTTWTDILAPVTLTTAVNGSIACTTVSGTIPAGTIATGANFKLRFKSLYTSPGDYYMGFDDVQLAQTATTPPSCTTISSPANAATGVSITPAISWAVATGGASSYLINIGTTPGGTNVMNGVDVGNVTTYTIPTATPLNYSTQYYIKIIPKNAIGNATGCTETSFTTAAMPCPSVTAPAASATGVSTMPVFSWSAVTGATGYKISLGTTSGGTNVLNNVDMGNVTTYSYTGTPLMLNTMYYYTITAYNTTTNSGTGCTVRSFTTSSVAPPANDNCSAPMALTVGTDFASGAMTVTNAGSSADGTAQSCQTSATNNVWFSVVVPASGNVKIETNSVASSTYTDSVINVFGGTCGSLTSIACDDDSSADGNFSLVSLTGQTPGATLLVSVWRYSSGTGTDGSFKVSAYDAVTLATSEAATIKNNVKAYPNPFTNVLNISDIANVKSVSVSDVSGRLVKSIDNPSSVLHLEDLKSGLYFVTLNLKDGAKQTIKAIKK